MVVASHNHNMMIFNKSKLAQKTGLHLRYRYIVSTGFALYSKTLLEAVNERTENGLSPVLLVFRSNRSKSVYLR